MLRLLRTKMLMMVMIGLSVFVPMRAGEEASCIGDELLDNPYCTQIVQNLGNEYRALSEPLMATLKHALEQIGHYALYKDNGSDLKQSLIDLLIQYEIVQFSAQKVHEAWFTEQDFPLLHILVEQQREELLESEMSCIEQQADELIVAFDNWPKLAALLAFSSKQTFEIVQALLDIVLSTAQTAPEKIVALLDAARELPNSECLNNSMESKDPAVLCFLSRMYAIIVHGRAYITIQSDTVNDLLRNYDVAFGRALKDYSI